MRTKHLFIGALFGSVSLGGASFALASSGIDSPENGVVQIGRGSTFVARADDPLAAYYNPGALALSKSGVHLGANLMFMKRCMTRRDANGNPVSPGGGIAGPGMEGGPAEPICADTTPFPNPQLAASFRITKNFAVGLAVMGPHGVGKMVWPESVPYTNQLGIATTQPAPQRLLLVESDSLIVNPTLSVSYAINDKISIGAGFIWGIASISFINFTEGVSSATTDEFAINQEVRSTLKAFDGFIPGFVVGVFSSPHKNLDLGAWFKWQDAVDTRTSLKLESGYWKNGGQPATIDPANVTQDDDAGTLKFRIPLEARLGVRYHHLRKAGSLAPQTQTGKKSRDPLAQDLFDVELDFTYSHNSVVQNLEVRFDPGIPVNGINGATVPTNADIPHNWKDVFGVRIGGDYVAIPGFLAIRAGGFFETNGQDPAYLNPDFHLGQRIGIGGGATVRLGPVDVSLGYQHTFFETLDNNGKGKVPGLSGDGGAFFEGTQYRTRHAANGGSLSSSLNEVALGGTYRF
jgi:long-chain fatty acid transport protein